MLVKFSHFLFFFINTFHAFFIDEFKLDVEFERLRVGAAVV
jgi:hypothetical protein